MNNRNITKRMNIAKIGARKNQIKSINNSTISYNRM